MDQNQRNFIHWNYILIMFDKEKLKLSDITSKTTPSIEYVTSNDVYKGDFDKYQPNLEVVNKIKIALLKMIDLKSKF